MSQTSGGGASITPGWYTDPHDPSQLRWWSGEGWTEHVSGGSSQPTAAQPAAQPAAAQAAAPAAAQPGDPLPSRRALRDPATEASEAAESALLAQQQALQAAQAAQQSPQAPQAPQAQQADYSPQQAQAPAEPAQQPAAQQGYPPQATGQASAPVPTLPVQPKSFLEQAGYPPLDAAPAAANAWNQPASPAQAPTPQAPIGQVSSAQVPSSQPTAWSPQPSAPQQPAAPAAPGQPAQPNAWNQPVQEQWGQPAAQLPPVQQNWGAPGAAAPAPATDGIDTLFGKEPAAAAAAPAYGAADQASWGLSPTGQNPQGAQAPASGSRRRGAESTAPESSGSSTFWGWLIAISPILAAGAIGYVIVSTGYITTGWPLEAAIAAPYLLVLLFALADRSALQTLGHSEPRSPGWALLSAPVYLIVRAGETRREDGSGTALTLVWFFSFLVAIAGFVGWGILTHHALYTGLPTSL